jgi:hypothetical protein
MRNGKEGFSKSVSGFAQHFPDYMYCNLVNNLEEGQKVGLPHEDASLNLNRVCSSHREYMSSCRCDRLIDKPWLHIQMCAPLALPRKSECTCSPYMLYPWEGGGGRGPTQTLTAMRQALLVEAKSQFHSVHYGGPPKQYAALSCLLLFWNLS